MGHRKFSMPGSPTWPFSVSQAQVGVITLKIKESPSQGVKAATRSLEPWEVNNSVNWSLNYSPVKLISDFWPPELKEIRFVKDFIFLGSKITADGDCSHEINVGEGEGGMICENGIETRIISYMKWIASSGSMHDNGYLGLVHWNDPEGWYGEGAQIFCSARNI